MGWKAVKEHYRIVHIVHVKDQGICIGSPYINDIMLIDRGGRLVKRYEGNSNKDLMRYQQEMDADPDTLRRLVEAADEFEKSVTVYTYEGGDIIEKRCEQLGYPHVTHDGELMYENTFSADKQYIIARAKLNAKAGIDGWGRTVSETEQRLSEQRALLAAEEAALAKLEAMYPEAEQASA